MVAFYTPRRCVAGAGDPLHVTMFTGAQPAPNTRPGYRRIRTSSASSSGGDVTVISDRGPAAASPSWQVRQRATRPRGGRDRRDGGPRTSRPISARPLWERSRRAARQAQRLQSRLMPIANPSARSTVFPGSRPPWTPAAGRWTSAAAAGDVGRRGRIIREQVAALLQPHGTTLDWSLLFGPVEPRLAARDALAAPVLGHLDPQFIGIMDDLRASRENHASTRGRALAVSGTARPRWSVRREPRQAGRRVLVVVTGCAGSGSSTCARAMAVR